MGNLRLHEIERFHTSGTSESERLKVTALNLFHPTPSPPFSEKPVVSNCATVSKGERGSLPAGRQGCGEVYSIRDDLHGGPQSYRWSHWGIQQDGGGTTP